MKSLDEVIKSITQKSGLQIIDVRNEKKDRFWVDRETYNDALYYLREYQEAKINLVKLRENIEKYAETRVQKEDILTDYVALKEYWTEQQANPPLTWDELKEMGGRPVWIKFGNDFEDHKDWIGIWRIVTTFTGRNEELACMNTAEDYPSSFYKKNMGVFWEAYRKETYDY